MVKFAGLLLVLACDYIAINTRKLFRIGITGPPIGIPYPLKALKLNKLTRFIKSIITQQRLINHSAVFPDETINHLLSSNPSSVPIVKMIRDHYERISVAYERQIVDKERLIQKK
ncbi:unnamed protein product [Rotaria sp. Silwood2]|nr:unnamed protein product [Rotaria sp. Silwood2]